MKHKLPKINCLRDAAARRIVHPLQIAALVLIVFTNPACASKEGSASVDAPVLPYEVIGRWPHATQDFTQGLVIHGGRLYESTGGYGHSRLYAKGLRDGTVLDFRALPARYFGEGLTMHAGQLVQLTWREGVVFFYGLDLRPVRAAAWRGEAWGLTSDGEQLILSDGSARLRFLQEGDLQEVRRIEVRDHGRPVPRLNELEYLRGRIYANVWFSDRIAVIHPATGDVEGWLDLSAIKQAMPKPPSWNPAEDVLNGIAYDAASGHLFVTGKRWPYLYELALVPPKLPVPARTSGP